MHIRRLTSLLLGAWLAGSLFMWMVATQNFRSVDRLLASPSAQAKIRIDKLGQDQARLLLRHHVGEQNRWYFETWEMAQLALGVLVLLALFFGSSDRAGLWLALVMLVVVGIQHWILTPEVVRLGRAIDFTSVDQPSAERTRFWMLHGAYSGTELLKLALGAVVSAKLVLGGRRRRSGGKEEEYGIRPE